MNKEKLQKIFLEKLLKGQKIVCQDDGDAQEFVLESLKARIKKVKEKSGV